MPHPIENIISSTMENLKNLIHVGTVVGDAVRLDADTLILPVSRVSLGFVTGGGEYTLKQSSALERCSRALDGEEARLPFAGTTAAGVTVTPVSFLTVRGAAVTVLPAQYTGGALERVIDAIPQMLSACREMAGVMRERAAERADCPAE